MNIPVNPPPPLTITSTSPLPNATLGAAYTFTFQATGGFGVLTWTLATGSTLPTGLGLSTAGVLSGTPTQFGGPFTFTVAVTDSESTPMTATATFSLTIVVAPLTITTTSLPDGTVGVAYSSMVTATGGVMPYTWSGSSTCGLGVANSPTPNEGLVSGSPTPVGSCTVTVTVTDSEAAQMTNTMTFTITINAAVSCTAGPTTLCGRFAFLAQGFVGPVATSDVLVIAGSILTTDGNTIVPSPGSELDVNSVSGPGGGGPQNQVNITSGTVTVGADGRGTITLVTPIGNFTFAFALNLTGTFAHIIEFDDTTGAGNHASGFMQMQDPTAFNEAAINGNYALGFVGNNSAGGRVGMIAVLVSTGVCDLNSPNGGTTATMTINNAGAASGPLPFTGSCGVSSINSTTGRVSSSLNITSSPFSNPLLVFHFYIINSSKLIFIGGDTPGANLPLLSGTASLQVNHPSGFSNSDVNCGLVTTVDVGCVFGLAGRSGSGAHVSAGRAVKQSNGTLTVTIDEDRSTMITKNVTTPGFTFTVSPAGNGTIASPTGKFSDLVLTDTDSGILLAAGGSVRFGIVRPQTATTLSASPGPFIIGTQFPANTAVPNASGIISPSAPATGTLAGTLDVEQILIPGAPVLIPGAPITGTYMLDVTTGRADGTTTAPGPSSFVVYVASANLLILIENDTMNPFPVLIFLTQ